MSSIAPQALTVRAVVRDVVAKVASEELPIVDGMAGLGDSVVLRRLRRRHARREPLGFGVAEIAVLVTPMVWLAVDQAAKQAADAAIGGVGAGIKALLRRIFRKSSDVVEIPPLTREQLVEVRRHVLELTEQRGVDQDRASAIADAVVARLALETPGHREEPLVSGNAESGAPPAE